MHQFLKFGKEVTRIVRSGGRFRVILHAEGGHIQASDSLDDPIIEISVGHFDARNAIIGDGVIVILTSNFNRSSGVIAHRVIGAVVTERELVGFGAHGQRQQLMT